MNETSKTRRLWGHLENSVLTGQGIDIGYGSDPITPDVRTFDHEDGDANEITQYMHEQFDFVFSSHCLEHMREPRKTILEWWKLVKPGGHLFFIVPDEDLYEQGVFPSRFNPEHKATFTISKAKSWSPVSINVLDLALSLPDGQLISLVLHDTGYDRRRLKHGPHSLLTGWLRRAHRRYRRYMRMKGRIPTGQSLFERTILRFVDDQTLKPDALAQIQCIVKKTNASH